MPVYVQRFRFALGCALAPAAYTILAAARASFQSTKFEFLINLNTAKALALLLCPDSPMISSNRVEWPVVTFHAAIFIYCDFCATLHRLALYLIVRSGRDGLPSAKCHAPSRLAGGALRLGAGIGGGGGGGFGGGE